MKPCRRCLIGSDYAEEKAHRLDDQPSAHRSKGGGREGCSESDQAVRTGAENPAPKEAEESRAVSPLKTCKEERTDATGTEEKAPSVPGPEGRKRVCMICSKPSEEMICGACADQVSGDALEKKRWEEIGKP